MSILFFETPDAFHAWLAEHHGDRDELWVGYYKKATKKQSVTWEETVKEALCYGWVDGVRKSLGEESYKIRFTPRKPRSNWSAVNIEKMKKLKKAGLVTLGHGATGELIEIIGDHDPTLLGDHG